VEYPIRSFVVAKATDTITDTRATVRFSL
jgi:hypothetical protein